MNDLQKTCRAALVQAAPVLFDKAACTEKAVKLIAKCAEGKARFIVFPELFIPGYPYGMSFGFTVGHREEDGRSDWTMYYENSILVPGEETARLAQAAKEAGAWVSIGVSERDAVTAEVQELLTPGTVLLLPSSPVPPPIRTFCHPVKEGSSSLSIKRAAPD